jgi:hypothetical protein
MNAELEFVFGSSARGGALSSPSPPPRLPAATAATLYGGDEDEAAAAAAAAPAREASVSEPRRPRRGAQHVHVHVHLGALSAEALRVLVERPLRVELKAEWAGDGDDEEALT